MAKKIKNPYVALFSKFHKAWVVAHRVMVANEVKFSHICKARDEAVARQIANSLNNDVEKPSNDSCEGGCL